MKLASPTSHVTVLERNPAGVTYGWGVVFWDDLLHDLYQNDPPSAREIHRNAVTWTGQVMGVAGEAAQAGIGTGFSISRRCLLDILSKRAACLGVDIRFQHEVERLSEVADTDLIVACDGVNSRLRQQRADHFRTEVDVGRNKYIWLGNPEDLRRLHVCVRANGRGVDLVPCLPLRRRDEHVYCRMPS